jgi:hypothetical protein
MVLLNKGDSLLDETKLTKQEAISFLDCMYAELHRHKYEAKYAHVLALINMGNEVKHQFWLFGEQRHYDDCNMILKTIKYLEEKYNLKPKGE